MNTAPLPSSSLLERLRIGTRHEHDLIEQAMPIFRNDFSVSDYFHLLQALRCFYVPYEAILYGVGPTLSVVLELKKRMKLPLLNLDLANYPNIETISQPQMPKIGHISEVIGAMYVFEGSSLGSRIIVRHIQKTLRLGLGETNFFRGYADETASLWSKFKKEAEKTVRPEDHDRAISTANETFSCLRCWLGTYIT